MLLIVIHQELSLFTQTKIKHNRWVRDTCPDSCSRQFWLNYGKQKLFHQRGTGSSPVWLYDERWWHAKKDLTEYLTVTICQSLNAGSSIGRYYHRSLRLFEDLKLKDVSWIDDMFLSLRDNSNQISLRLVINKQTAWLWRRVCYYL